MYKKLELYPIQRDFIEKAQNIIENEKVGIFSSPTGTGKTMSLLCSLIKFVEKQEDEHENLSKENKMLMEQLFGEAKKKCKIFYCSKTHIQLNQAIKELKNVLPNVNAVIVGSRKLYCQNKSVNKYTDANIVTEKCKDLVNNNSCNLYNNYNENRTKTITGNILDIEEINKTCNKNQFCSYFYAKEYAQRCEIIFLPYTLLFSKEGRQSLDIDLKDSIIVVDEAHNIYDIVLQMNTVTITNKIIKKYYDAFQKYKQKYEKRMLKVNLDKIKSVICILQKLIDFFANINENKENLIMNESLIVNKDVLAKESKKIDNKSNNCELLNGSQENEVYTKVLSVSNFLITSYLDDYNMLDLEEYMRENKITEKLEGFNTNLHHQLYNIAKFLRLLVYSDTNGRIFYNKHKIQFMPLDASMYFEDILDCKSLILAGGTMEPIDNLQRVMKDREIEYHSYPSVCNNFIGLIVSIGPTKKQIKLNFDTKNNQETISEVLKSVLNFSNLVKKGGIICFLPSKSYLQIFKNETNKYKFNKKIMFDDEYCFFDYKAAIEKEEQVILFSVMGGKLSEGVNFNDDLCRLLIVIGVPYPTYNLETQEKIKYYGNSYTKLVAMQTVNQSIGRALRHKDDYSAIVLLDIRFNDLTGYLSPWIKEKIVSCGFPNAILSIAKFYKQTAAK